MEERDGFLHPNYDYNHSDLINFADYLKIPFAGYVYSNNNNIAMDGDERFGGYWTSTPINDGRIFMSWFSNNGFDIESNYWSQGYSLRCFKDAYMDTTYTLTFDSQGGSAVTGQTVLSGEIRTRPYRPTNSGYYFA